MFPCIKYKDLTQLRSFNIMNFPPPPDWKERQKITIATEQTTFLFPLNPGCPLSVTLSETFFRIPLTSLHSGHGWPHVFLLPQFLSETEGSSAWAAFLLPWETEEYRFPSFYWLVATCSLCLCICLVRLKPSNSCRGHVMCRRVCHVMVCEVIMPWALRWYRGSHTLESD